MAEAAHLENPGFSVYPDTGRIGDFEIIETPGHSEGHVSVIYSKKILFGGDLFFCRDGKLSPANPAYSEDVKQAEESLRNLLKLKFTILCPAHGEPEKRKNVRWEEKAI